MARPTARRAASSRTFNTRETVQRILDITVETITGSVNGEPENVLVGAKE